MNVFDLYAKLSLDTSQYTEGLNDAKKSTSTLGSAIKSGFGTAVKVAGAALTAATTAVTAFGAASVKNFAAYEQLVGGVDKLYGDASEKLQAYADAAYKTAGMSANQYMETATSFSAALINSLGGDVDKAADMTDMAMRAMSDNVNVFGSDMSAVQSAFQGFAKQNYTMLDNLKLGYGGTKSEMERLIADANDYRKSIGESADLSIESFADIVQAIQSVQEAQNIAGTTNKEAMSTIEGSANAVKAAWQNVITAIGRGEGLKEAFSNFTSALFGESEGEGLLNQIIPRIETTMEGIGGFIEEAAPLIADKLPALVSAVLPNAVNAGIQLLGALGQGLVDNAPLILDSILELVGIMADTVVNSAPQMIKATADLLTTMGNKIADAVDVVVPAMTDLIIGMAEALTNPESISSLIDAAMNIISALADGLLNAIPQLVQAVPTIIDNLVTALTNNLGKVIDGVLQLVNGVLGALPTIIQALVKAIPKIITSVVNALKSAIPQLVQGVLSLVQAIAAALPEILPVLIDAIPIIINSIVSAVLELLPVLLDGVIQLIMGLVAALPDIIIYLVDALPDIINTIIDALMDNLPLLIAGAIQLVIGIVEALPEIIAGLIEAIPGIITSILGAFGGIVEGLAGVFSRAWEGIKEVFSGVGNWFSEKFAAAKEGAQKAWDGVTSFFDGVWTNIKGAFSNVGSWFSQTFSTAKENSQKAWDKVGTKFGAFWTEIKNAFDTGGSEGVRAWFLSKFQQAYENIQEAFSKVGEFFAGVWKDIKEAFKIEDALQWGKDLIENFINGIKSMASKVGETISGVADDIKKFLGFSEPEEGPLSNFHTFAPDMMKLFAEGIDQNADIVNDAIERNFDFSDAIISSGENAEDAYRNSTSSALGQVISLLQEIVEHGLDVGLEGDAREIFRVVEKQNRQRTKATGYNTLAMAGTGG